MRSYKQHVASRRFFKSLSVAAITAVAATTYAPPSEAGATFKIDDTKWVSIGAGLRTSFRTVEDGAANGKWTNHFNLDNIRLYVNAQIHEYIKIEFNTDCQTCGNGGEVRVLDAIGKFEFHPMINIWAGRMLVPAERREMNGPFYSSIYNIFATGTPFEPADFNLTIKSDGTSAGSFGRDDGATIWGSFMEGRFQYAIGVFRGLRGGANDDDNLLYAQRFSYNFWDVEKNPGYYTSGTYYGTGGDILTLAVSNQYQEDGAGISSDSGNFRGTTVDVLLEKVLANDGVFTFNGEYKNYNINSGYSQASRDAGGGFAMFEGHALDVSVMYLMPDKIAIGKLQPYARYVGILPDGSSDRDVYELGLNYIIDGHNAMLSLSWQYGDSMTKGLDYSSTASGDDVHAITLGLQLQI